MHESRLADGPARPLPLLDPRVRPGRQAAPEDAEVQVFRSLGAVPAPAWDRLTAGRSPLLQRGYLAAQEAGASDEVGTRYALLGDAVAPEGVACFHLTDFVSQPLGPLLGEAPAPVALVARRLGLLEGPLRVRLLVCGDLFAAGPDGLAFRPDVPPARAAGLLAAAARRIQATLPEAHRARAVLIKDFRPGDAAIPAHLPDHGFCRVETEPGMVLTLDPGWATRDDYLDALTSHYRVKARRALARSADLSVRDLHGADLAAHLGPLAALQAAVLDRADRRLGRLGVGALPALRQALGEDLLLRGYFLGDRLVGWASGLVAERTLVALCVGLDYGVSRDLGLYPRILLDYLEEAIRRRLARVDYGRTASEIKSTLGAEAVPLHVWLRHEQGTLNRLLPVVTRFVSPPPYAHRTPFRRPGATD